MRWKNRSRDGVDPKSHDFEQKMGETNRRGSIRLCLKQVGFRADVPPFKEENGGIRIIERTDELPGESPG